MERDLPNLSVHQMLYVREAARAPSWTAAARRLAVSQPALSQGVAEAERRLGVTLFDRSARTRRPTSELELALPVIESILASLDDLDRSLLELTTGGRGVCRVGMIDTAALGTLSETLLAFRRDHPNVTTTLLVEPSAPLTERVAEGALDLAIVVTPNDIIDATPAAFRLQPLLDEPLHVYAPGRPARGLRVDRWGPWVSYPTGSQSRRLIEHALASAGAPFVVVAESSNPDVLRQMVRLGVGWCVLPRHVAERSDLSPPLHRIPGRPLTHRSLALVRRRNSLPNAAADSLAAALVAATRHDARRGSRRP